MTSEEKIEKEKLFVWDYMDRNLLAAKNRVIGHGKNITFNHTYITFGYVVMQLFDWMFLWAKTRETTCALKLK